MKRIYKYPLVVTDFQQIQLPDGAACLSVQMQDDALVLWALVDDQERPALRGVRIIGTGHGIGLQDLDGYRYLATVQDLSLVWHVFVAASRSTTEEA